VEKQIRLLQLDRFEQAWHRGEAGTSRSSEVRLTFESLPVLLKNLTPARWKLLEAVKRSGPMSVNELARLLGRNYKNVHTDVTRLVELGLIERFLDQRIAVAWDTITAEMKLAGWTDPPRSPWGVLHDHAQRLAFGSRERFGLSCQISGYAPTVRSDRRTTGIAMDIKPISTKRDYEGALRTIETLMSAKRGTAEGDKLDVLATLVETYESKHFPLDLLDPVDAKF
jgi:predicted transcriptional regulator